VNNANSPETMVRCVCRGTLTPLIKVIHQGFNCILKKCVDND